MTVHSDTRNCVHTLRVAVVGLVGALLVATGCQTQTDEAFCDEATAATFVAPDAAPAERSAFDPNVFHGIRFNVDMGPDTIAESRPDGNTCFLRCGTSPLAVDRTFAVMIDASKTVTVEDAYGKSTSPLSAQELVTYNQLRGAHGMLAATQVIVANSSDAPCPPAPAVEWSYTHYLNVVDEKTGRRVALEALGCITGTTTPSDDNKDVAAMSKWLRELGRSRVSCEETHQPDPDPKNNAWLRPLCVFDWSCALGIDKC